MKRFLILLFLFFSLLCPDAYATVADATYKSVQNCNSSVTAFPFTFGIGATSEIQVIRTVTATGVETTLTETTDYTVDCTNNDCSAGGTVNTVAVCASGSTITLKMNVPYTQDSDYVEGMPTLYETFEDNVDKLTRIAQQLKGRIADAETEIAAITPATLTGVFYYRLADYSSISSAVSAMGANNATLLCDSPITMVDNPTVPVNVSFMATKGCIITTTGYTLTVNGSLSAGPYQIFTGTGTVSGLKESYPEWWGIDGTTDNAEITYAANALSSGGILHLDATTYNIADIVYLPDYVTVRGKGYNSVLKAIADFGDKAILRTSNKTGVVIENLRIDGNRAANTTATQYAHAVAFAYAKKSAVRNCWLDNNVGDGVYIGEGSEDIEVVDNFMYDNYRNGVSDLGGYRHRIEGNISVSTSTNIVGCIDLEPNDDVVLQDISVQHNICHITGTKPYGIVAALDNVTTDANLKNIIIANNQIHGDGTDGPTVGIYGHGARGVTISDNEVYAPKTDGIYVDDGATNASHSCSVKGNTVYGAPRYGIISKADNTPVQNNIVHAVAGSTMTHGIYSYYASGVVCTGNQVYIPSISGTSTFGINFAGTSISDLIVTNNYVYSDSADGNIGLSISGASVGQVHGNIFKNFSTGVSLNTNVADSVWVRDNDYSECTIKYANASQTVIGTINLSTRGTSLLYSAAGAVTATLPNGDEVGQVKVIKMSNATATSTVSVTHHETSDPEVFEFGAVTDILILMWNGLEWVTVNNQGVATP